MIYMGWYRGCYPLGHMYLGSGLVDVLRGILSLIEGASSLFRSISLSLRLVCNSIAGHILLGILLDMCYAITTALYDSSSMYYEEREYP